MENQIAYLETTHISPHPQNPRKDLGDLTELAASIKANGIMQNLTVVRKPWSVNDDKPIDYTVVIGHRRLAAAKMADLNEVPCVIVEMDDRQQLATMMLENMQRSDLTIIEQAEGFQMMMELGETLQDIARQTGFSESTVRRRVKLLELDPEKLREAASRGATLMDFAELDKIADPERKNKVLESIGTANFRYELKRALDDAAAEEHRAALIEQVEAFATTLHKSETDGLKRVRWYHCSAPEIEKPEDADERAYFYTASQWDITLYVQQDAQEIAALDDAAIEREKQQARRNDFDQIAKRAYELRYDFVVALPPIKQKMPEIAELMIRATLDNAYINIDLPKMLGVDCGDADDIDYALVESTVQANPKRAVFLTAYANYGDGANCGYHDYSGKYRPNESLDALYDILLRLGYALSDEEQAYRDGTHELFADSTDICVV